jgi:hypothetical protein
VDRERSAPTGKGSGAIDLQGVSDFEHHPFTLAEIILAR